MNENISFGTRVFGSYILQVDKATTSCIVSEYARILLETNVTKELSLEVTFECFGVQHKVEVSFENLLVFW